MMSHEQKPTFALDIDTFLNRRNNGTNRRSVYESMRKKEVYSRLAHNGGQLKLNISISQGTMSVEIIQARHLVSKWKRTCDSFTKVSLVPNDDEERTKFRSSLAPDSNNPQYNETAYFKLLDEDKKKRLLISVWHNDKKSCSTELLGCMSFGMRNLLSQKKVVCGWYYLLNEEMGRRRHLQKISTRLSSTRKNELELEEDESLTMTDYNSAISNLSDECFATPCDDGSLTGISYDDTVYRFVTSTPAATKTQNKQSTKSSTDDVSKLLHVELNYIHMMHNGIEKYSRPLRHCLLSSKEHATLFQNVEKLVMISEFLIQQIQESFLAANVTESGLLMSVAEFYQSKIELLCRAYETYCMGLSDADGMVSELMKLPRFQKYLKFAVSTENNDLHIGTFILRPREHLKDMLAVFKEIASADGRSASETLVLQKIISALQSLVEKINTCKRSTSVSSLASLESKDSGTGTMRMSECSFTSC